MKKLLSVLAAAALIAAIGAAQRLVPDADRTYQPIASTGTIGQEVRTLPYSVRVNRVRLGRELQIKKKYVDTPEKKVTKGVWVVLDLTATATQEQVTLGDVELRALNGTRYAATDRFQGLDTTDLEAGIPASGSVAFELPPDAAKGAVLLITNARYPSVHRLNRALGPAVEIELGITGAPAQTVTIEEKGL